MARFKLINGERFAFTAEEETARDAEEAVAVSYKAANDYKFKRASEYPSVVDQLDLIYHSGIDAWKAKIKETKDKYPKP
tara:strand:- start:901 stop:1137 length:237 start_codon:yes stop_codon:yes gene_type:complete